MKVTKKPQEKEKSELVITNKTLEGFKNQKNEDVTTKEFLVQILTSPGEKGLSTTEMRSRVFVINKLQSNEPISLSKDEWMFTLNVLQGMKFPQIIMSVLELEETIANLVSPKEDSESK